MANSFWDFFWGKTRFDGVAGEDDLCNIMLVRDFDSFINFVTVDKAQEYYDVNDKVGKGLDRLKQESKLKSPSKQGAAAKEMLALYDWWVNIRPNRVNPYTHLIEEKVEIEDMETAENIFETYEKEDQDMFLRLAKIRPHLFS